MKKKWIKAIALILALWLILAFPVAVIGGT